MSKKKRGRTVKKASVKKKATKKKAAKTKKGTKKPARKKVAKVKKTHNTRARASRLENEEGRDLIDGARKPPPQVRDAPTLEPQNVATQRAERERSPPRRSPSSRRRHSRRLPREPKLGGKKPKFCLEELTPERQAEVDALLVRVYLQAAKDLRELEAREADSAKIEDAKVVESYEKARREIMRTLTRWEQRKKDE